VNEKLRSSEVAALVGVGVATLRYYERRGLVPPPARRPSGYREYTPAAVARVRLIRLLEEAGFSLRQIGDLLLQWDDPSASPAQMLRQFLRATDQKLATLQEARNELATLLDVLAHGGPRPDLTQLGDHKPS
jgi:MerR family transcriptional regulator, copper efflux regulator